MSESVAPATFFRSRWVERPVHVAELDSQLLPAGFRAAGVAAGIKAEGLDVGVVVSDEPGTVSAARFTTNARVGAPVIVSREAALDRLRAVVANSGCSNVGDGERGMETARAMQRAAAEELGVEVEQVAVASTGVIGVELPRENVVAGARAACGALGADAEDFSRAILTSDAGPKRACLEVSLSAGTVRLSAQAKGAGMISPRHATMFCFIQTDAALDAETLELLTGVCVKRSFDRISVDGQLSTSDTVVALASGASDVRVEPQSANELALGEALDAETLELLTGVCVKRSFDRISVDGQLSTSDTVVALANGASDVRVEPQSADELALGEALDALLRQLALEIVHDGEGARRVGRVLVTGRPDTVEPVARAVANSPLVKSALHGGDPNFGRILQAAGQVWPPGEPFIVDLEIEGHQVVSAGEVVEPAPAELVQGDEVEYALTLPGEGGETEVFFSDLSPEYVNFNAEYTS